MNKEQFLELAGQAFDQINQSESKDKISLSRNLFDEIVDQISSDIFEAGVGLIDNYELSMYSREVELDSVSFNLSDIEYSIKNVLERYFETK